MEIDTKARRPAGTWRSMGGLALALTLIAAGAPPALGQDSEEDSQDEYEEKLQLSISAGFSYSSGDYGEAEKTEIISAPLTIKAEHYPFIAKVSVPYIRIKGPGDVVAGTGGGAVTTGANGGARAAKRTRETKQGLGDVVASLSYIFYRESLPLPQLELTGKVKFPTAVNGDSLGQGKLESLGTGKFDYTLQLDAARSFGRITPLGTLGYRFMGDPKDVDLENVFFASAGAGYRFTSWLNAGLIYDWSQSTSKSAGDSHELVPYATIKLGRHFSLGPYAALGLSQDAADYAVGAQLSVTP